MWSRTPHILIRSVTGTVSYAHKLNNKCNTFGKLAMYVESVWISNVNDLLEKCDEMVAIGFILPVHATQCKGVQDAARTRRSSRVTPSRITCITHVTTEANVSGKVSGGSHVAGSV
jgi:hypothetical protein